MKLAVAAALSAAALFTSDARAADTFATYDSYPNGPPVVERMRTVCDGYGRCWQERLPARAVIEQDGYDAPTPRYVERRYDPYRPAGVSVYRPDVNVDLDDDDDD
ncbi:hypothetical protein [Afipia sp. P52-10]|uniref:hypothetical protein n=1 Tax=Afipia sp. P52-10 TaxID=1429916 RepID=UPI00126850A1|nr:hypothetical protein [Afipia sp. P52-10]